MSQKNRAEEQARSHAQKLSDARSRLAPLGAEYSIRGLTTEELNQRVALGLVNNYRQASSRSIGAILRANLITLFNTVVGGAFLILLALGQWRDALFGIAVVSNILIGTIQEFRAKRTLDKLSLLHQPKAHVIRDGLEVEITAQEIALDDILILRTGDQALADGTVLEADSLEIDESMLTGESDAVPKSRTDRVLAGAGVVGGSGRIRVDAIGVETYASTLTLEAKRFSLVSSELRSSLEKVVKWISWLLVPFMAVTINGQMVAAGGWQSAIASGAWQDALIKSVASISSMIPQGLILMTSIAFAIAAVTLANKKVLVQELPAVEGLARVDVICFDKTGTLTEGRIVFNSVDEFSHSADLDWRAVLAHFANDELANATARSLRDEFSRSLTDALVVRSSMPFNSTRKWSAFEFETSPSGTETWVLGAPEFVLSGDASKNADALRSSSKHSAEAMRTLVLAKTGERLNGDLLPTDLQVAAVVALQEEVRSDAAKTIKYFTEQGVSIRIISGDSVETVAAIARKARVQFDGVGYDARQLPEDIDSLADILESNTVFGRVTPEQKRNMVLALQSRNHVVAMTGDGVNDALALKKADLGIAMNSGAAATKAVANMVLLDGKFSNLPGVVAEGRKVIANIERVSRLFLTKTAWSMTLALFFGIAMWTFPYLPRQLSGIDGFTIGIPAFLLALLPNAQRYKKGFLQRSLRFTVPAGLVIGIAVIVLNWMIREDGSWTISEVQTATSILLSVAGLWILTLLSFPLNRPRALILVGMVALCLVEFFLPWSLWFFSWVPLSQPQLMLTMLVALVTNAVVTIAVRLLR